MSRALYKLSKAFSEQPAPRNVADRVRRQIEKFKAYQTLLNVICNPGIRDRHWKKVGAGSSGVNASSRLGGTSLVSRLSACLTETNWWRLVAE